MCDYGTTAQAVCDVPFGGAGLCSSFSAARLTRCADGICACVCPFIRVCIIRYVSPYAQRRRSRGSAAGGRRHGYVVCMFTATISHA